MHLDQAMELWFHYEEIAMHFNELIIQYRLQLMGGIGAIGAVSGYLIGSKVDDEGMRHKLRAFVATGLFILFIAAAVLDIFYYNELLRGAVAAIIELESNYPELNLSTTIKNQFDENFISASWRIYIAYLLVMIPLAVFMVWSWANFKISKTKKQDSSP